MRRLLEHQRSRRRPSCCTRRRSSAARSGAGRTSGVADVVGEAPEPEIEVDLFSLMTAFRQVLERVQQRPRVLLPPEQMPIEERIEQLLARLSETEACGFEDLFDDVQTRAGMIVTFLAAARDDSPEARARLPAGQLRPDSRLPPRTAGRSAFGERRARRHERDAADASRL